MTIKNIYRKMFLIIAPIILSALLFFMMRQIGILCVHSDPALGCPYYLSNIFMIPAMIYFAAWPVDAPLKFLIFFIIVRTILNRMEFR